MSLYLWLIFRSNPFYEPKSDSPDQCTTESMLNTKRRAPLPPAAPSVTPARPAVPNDPKPAVPDKVSIPCPAIGLRELASSSPKVRNLPHILTIVLHDLLHFNSFSSFAAPVLILLHLLFFLSVPSLHIPPFCCSASVVCICYLNTGMHYVPYACVMSLLAQCFGACN